VAGLRTSVACVRLLDLPQLAAKVLPQAALLALDKAPELRELALQLLDAATDRLRAAHRASEAKAAQAPPPAPTTVNAPGPKGVEDFRANIGELPSHGSSHSNATNSWASWAGLQGPTKESPSPRPDPPQTDTLPAPSPSWGDLDLDDLEPPGPKKKDKKDDLDDLDLDDLDLDDLTPASSQGSGAWGMDDSSASNAAAAPSAPLSRAPKPSSGGPKKPKAPKVSVKKLEVARDADWDDF